MNWEMNMEVISQKAVARKVFFVACHCNLHIKYSFEKEEHCFFPLDELTCIIIDLLLLFLVTNLFLFPFVPQ